MPHKYVCFLKRIFQMRLFPSFFSLRVGRKTAILSVLIRSGRTCRTQSLKYIIHSVQDKSFRCLHHRNRLAPEAESAMASFAIEMYVLVAHRTSAIVAAYRIFQCARAVVDGMNQVAVQKQRDGAEYGGLIHGLQFFFQIGLRHGTVHLHHRTENQQTDGCGFHVP